MALTRWRVKVETPTRTIVPGRGFYQLEEDVLCVQVGPFAGRRQCFSSLESASVRLDMDRWGRLIGLEVFTPRRQWPQGDVECPRIAEPADIRWLDFRQQMQLPRLATDDSRSRLLITFGDPSNGLWYLIASHVFVRVNDERAATALLVVEIEDDLAGRGLGLFREAINKASGHTTLKVISADA